MFVLMMLAFFTAGFAEFRTNTADIFCFVAAQAHKLCSRITDRSALHVQLNTACHHLNVFFLSAGYSAMIADCCAFQAGIYAGLVLVISFHGCIFK
jgi:hypothetical protein